MTCETDTTNSSNGDWRARCTSWVFGGPERGWRVFFDTATARIALLALASIPFSTTATDILTVSTVVGWLLSGDYRAKFATLRACALCKVSAVLYALFLVGCLYSAASWGEILEAVVDYRKLLFLPIYYTIFLKHAEHRKYAVGVIHICMVLSLVASYLVYWGWLPQYKPQSPNTYFKIHMAHAFMMACWVAILSILPVKSRILNGARWAALALVVLNTYWIGESRTGHILVLTAILCWLACRFTWKQTIFIGGPVLLAFLAVAYGVSGTCRERTQKTATDIRNAFQGLRRDTKRTNLYANAFQIIVRSPVIGHGTGSIPSEFAKQPSKSIGRGVSDPHNEYLAIGIQLGLIGVVAYLAWMAAVWRRGYRMASPEGRVLLTLAVLFAVNSLFNSAMLNTTESQFYVFLVGLFAAGPIRASEQADAAADDESR